MKLILHTIWIFKLSEVTSLVKIFYVFGRLLNTDHAFSVLRNYLSISFNIAYLNKTLISCVRQNQINERVIDVNKVSLF